MGWSRRVYLETHADDRRARDIKIEMNIMSSTSIKKVFWEDTKRQKVQNALFRLIDCLYLEARDKFETLSFNRVIWTNEKSIVSIYSFPQLQYP